MEFTLNHNLDLAGQIVNFSLFSVSEEFPALMWSMHVRISVTECHMDFQVLISASVNRDTVDTTSTSGDWGFQSTLQEAANIGKADIPV